MSKEKKKTKKKTYNFPKTPIYSDIREKYSNFENKDELVAVLERKEVTDTLEQNEMDFDN